MSRSVTARALDAPLTLDGARAHVAAGALHEAPIGLVGLELETHAVDLTDPAHRPEWSTVNAFVDALPDLDAAVTLEPGGQVELSGPPAPLEQAVASLRADLELASGADARLGLAPLGADPLRPARRRSPGARYVAMERHFAGLGRAAPGLAMMTSTAALQVNLDAGPRAGWAARVGLAHRLGPVLIAVSACSPMLAGASTGWRSSRQRIWSELDQARCGPLLGRDEPADEWAEYALCAPVMLMHGAGGSARAVTTAVPFADWVTGAAELGGRRPTLADLDYHLTTLFPPVRLRGFLEIRYLDAAPEPWWPALAALTTVLLDDPVAADAAAQAVEPVAGRWDDAARLGLTDPDLARAARAVLAVAADRVPDALRAPVHALAELVASGRSPGDVLPGGSPATVLLAATGRSRS